MSATPTTVMRQPLPIDLVEDILAWLDTDYATLFQCTQVSWEWLQLTRGLMFHPDSEYSRKFCTLHYTNIQTRSMGQRVNNPEPEPHFLDLITGPGSTIFPSQIRFLEVVLHPFGEWLGSDWSHTLRRTLTPLTSDGAHLKKLQVHWGYWDTILTYTCHSFTHLTTLELDGVLFPAHALLELLSGFSELESLIMKEYYGSDIIHPHPLIYNFEIMTTLAPPPFRLRNLDIEQGGYDEASLATNQLIWWLGLQPVQLEGIRSIALGIVSPASILAIATFLPKAQYVTELELYINLRWMEDPRGRQPGMDVLLDLGQKLPHLQQLSIEVAGPYAEDGGTGDCMSIAFDIIRGTKDLRILQLVLPFNTEWDDDGVHEQELADYVQTWNNIVSLPQFSLLKVVNLDHEHWFGQSGEHLHGPSSGSETTRFWNFDISLNGTISRVRWKHSGRQSITISNIVFVQRV